MSESMSANHRRRHAKSSKLEMCDREASSSSLTLIREDATNALCPPPKTRRRSSRREHDRKRPEKSINGGQRDRRKAEEAMSMDVSMSRSARCQTSKRTSRRSSRRRHERKRPEKGHGGYRDRRKTEGRASTDASVVTPIPNPRRRSNHRDPSSRDSPIWDRSTRAFCRSNDDEERRELVENEIKHVKKNAKVDHREYDSMNPTSKRLDLSSRKHRRHAHKINEERYVASSSPVHNKLEYSDSLRDGSRTRKYNISEEERREVVEKAIKHGTKNAEVDHCEYDSSESTLKRLDSSNRKHGRHACNINEERCVSSSSSPLHNKLESSEYCKNDKIKSMHGGSPRRSKQLVVHCNNGRNKNRIVADHRTYIGPSMFLYESDRSFARRMISERLRRDQQWKEGRLKRLKNKMAIIFHHHHHHHHHRHHGHIVEVLERLARYVWRPEKAVAGRRGGGSGRSDKPVKQRCLWGRRGGGSGVKVGGRRQPVLLLSRRRSQKKMVSLGDKKGKRS